MNLSLLVALTSVFLGSVWILTRTDTVTNDNVCSVDDESCQQAYTEPGSASTDSSCQDQNENCAFWAKSGECTKNPNYMLTYCANSCNSCDKVRAPRKAKKVAKAHKKSPSDTRDNSINTVDKSQTRAGREVKYQYGDPNDVDSVDLSQIDTSECPEQFPNCTACRDINQNCAFFGRKGECEAHPGWMVMNCGQTCKFCHMHDYYTRCVNPASSAVNEAHQAGSKVFDKAGDLDEFYLNLLRHYVVHKFVVRDIEWEYEILSKPAHLSIENEIRSIETAYNVEIIRDGYNGERDVDEELLSRLMNVETSKNLNKKTKNGPWVVIFDKYMDEIESAGIIEAAPEFQRSTDVGKKDASGHFTQITSKSRTSLNSWCQSECWAHPMVQQVMTRVEVLFNISMDNTEHLQILEYSPGQYYKTHHDYIGQQIGMPCGPRIMTFYMYLSDVEEGGETGFPRLGIAVSPKLGRAVLWPSVRNDAPDQIDSRTYHEAKPVKKGIKYGANSWFHLYDFQTPNIWSCTG